MELGDPVPPEVVELFAEAFWDAAKRFMEAQRELPDDAARILYDNLWDLYE